MGPILVRFWDTMAILRGQNIDLEAQLYECTDLASSDLARSYDKTLYWIGRPLQWRHNRRNGVSNHQPHDCLLNRLFGRGSKKSYKTAKLRVTGLCVGNSPVNGEFPAQMASNAENVSIWWRHHDNLVGIGMFCGDPECRGQNRLGLTLQRLTMMAAAVRLYSVCGYICYEACLICRGFSSSTAKFGKSNFGLTLNSLKRLAHHDNWLDMCDIMTKTTRSLWLKRW